MGEEYLLEQHEIRKNYLQSGGEMRKQICVLYKDFYVDGIGRPRPPKSPARYLSFGYEALLGKNKIPAVESLSNVDGLEEYDLVSCVRRVCYFRVMWTAGVQRLGAKSSPGTINANSAVFAPHPAVGPAMCPWSFNRYDGHVHRITITIYICVRRMDGWLAGCDLADFVMCVANRTLEKAALSSLPVSFRISG
ncbi:hypothetical protein ACLOJK_012762 [Asimina triloba]